MAAEDTNSKVQRFLDAFRVQSAERETVSVICGFSSSHPKRELVFQGLPTMHYFSQLSLLTGQLGQLIHIDPFTVLPCELSLKILAYLNATSMSCCSGERTVESPS
ncbi:hypothetical protein M405DRAFT_413802 [Rhizopogon salebrosus TDB-379]|nr:hypothetical protein M405DRAFT_413802 [Rhizopogon salebrosus TDB-379]